MALHKQLLLVLHAGHHGHQFLLHVLQGQEAVGEEKVSELLLKSRLPNLHTHLNPPLCLLQADGRVSGG